MTQLVLASPVRLDRAAFAHAARTAAGAMLAVLCARLFGLRESYWAAVTTMIVLQSTLGAALSVSALRLIGTALGAAAGVLQAAFFGPNVLVFGVAVFFLGVSSAALHLDRSAFRFAGITLAIVALVVRDQSPWVIAAHRFVEVSIGIVVGLLMTAVWQDRQAPSSIPNRRTVL